MGQGTEIGCGPEEVAAPEFGRGKGEIGAETRGNRRGGGAGPKAQQPKLLLKRETEHLWLRQLPTRTWRTIRCPEFTQKAEPRRRQGRASLLLLQLRSVLLYRQLCKNRRDDLPEYTPMVREIYVESRKPNAHMAALVARDSSIPTRIPVLQAPEYTQPRVPDKSALARRT